MEASSQQVLLKELSDVLGFEDGAEDVLDHLMTIDSRQDLLDYLSQLLGSTSDKIKSFVDHVVAVQHGHEIAGETNEAADSKKPSAATSVAAKNTIPAVATVVDQAKPLAMTRGPSIARIAPPPIKREMPPSTIEEHPAPPPNPPDKGPEKSSSPPPPPKSIPQKGKASYVCGCYGTKHKPLANCLVCGRISCDREGYDFCPFCGFLVGKPPEGVSRTDPAWLHKERLLRFDRESAQRMIVIDDESSNHAGAAAANSQMAWLTQEESDRAVEMQREREQNLRQRPKMQLDLDL